MSASGSTLAIQLEERGATVLWAAPSRSGVHVSRCEFFERPEGVDPSSARALGTWIRETIGDERLPRRVVMVVPRAEVIHKQLSLPAELAGDAVALPGAVHLKMTRHVVGTGVGGVTDFVTLPAVGGEVGVVAATLPGPRLGLLKELARALAQRPAASIGLRSSGASAVAAARIVDADSAVLVIAPGMVSTELIVVRHGLAVFARSVELGLRERGTSPEEFRDRLVIEAQRTAMSHGGASAGVVRVLLLGPREALDEVRVACAKAMALEAQCLDHPAFVTFEGGMSPDARAAALSMAGVVAEGGAVARAFDFASPRRAPDRAAGKRQMALGAMLGVILLFGGLWVWAGLTLRGKERVIGELVEEQESLSKRVLTMRLEEERLNHLDRWMSPEVDWIAHLSWITRACPGPPGLLVDQVSGKSQFEVEFEPKSRSTEGGAWSSRLGGMITLSGSTSDPELANALRARLLESGLYTVENKQADTPNRFGFDLITGVPRPVEQSLIERAVETAEAQE